MLAPPLIIVRAAHDTDSLPTRPVQVATQLAARANQPTALQAGHTQVAALTDRPTAVTLQDCHHFPFVCGDLAGCGTGQCEGTTRLVVTATQRI
jgi:hypothetical protein